jgi:hypothetical protein
MLERTEDGYRIYLIWSSYAGDEPHLLSAWTTRKAAEVSLNRLIELDEYSNDYWILEKDVFV